MLSTVLFVLLIVVLAAWGVREHNWRKRVDAAWNMGCDHGWDCHVQYLQQAIDDGAVDTWPYNYVAGMVAANNQPADRQPGCCTCGEPALPDSDVCIDCGYQAHLDAMFSAAFE